MIEDLLNSTFLCDCGKNHNINIKDILIKEDAVHKLPKLLDKLTVKRKVLIICDTNTYQAAGKKAKKILNNNRYKAETLKLKEKDIKPNPNNIFRILNEINKDQYVIACGSGTINDMTRYVTYKLEIPYSVIATAPSMDGYASSVSSITVNGVKNTYTTKPAEAIIADINVLSSAPKELIQAGYGDLIGKTTSLLDWKLSNILFNEYYCNKTVKIVENELKNILNLAETKDYRAHENIETLIRGLIYSGLAMLMVGTSRPASGSEHHVSHFLEMFGSDYNIDMPLHGVKVGIATIFTTAFYLKLKEIDFNDIIINLNKKERIKNIKKIYGQHSDIILNNLEKRWNNEYLTKDQLISKEKQIKERIDQQLNLIVKARNILLNDNVFDKNIINKIPKSLLNDALNFGFEIRPRYTITTLLNQIGKLDNFVFDITNKLY